MSSIKADNILLIVGLILVATISYGQTIRGYVVDQVSGTPLSGTEIYYETELQASCAENGTFSFQINAGNEIELIIFHDQYALLDTILTRDQYSQELKISLSPLAFDLTEVEIQARRKELFTIRQLRDVEGTTINSGKKTEVVVLDQITANLASNQTRQIYAQVAGLNIYEGSDGGLQLAIGGRGLDPNRTANFNTRQNGYDISADVLGYPESYYTPPAHAIREIQMIRGASSLQYGTQFGGLINFKLNELEPKKNLAIRSAQTVGSFGLFDSFNQLTLREKKWSINTYYNFKKGDGYRNNSEYDSHNAFVQFKYKPNTNSTLTGEVTLFNYLAKQAGGLTDTQFKNTPRLSTRDRNWFKVDWKLYNLKYEHELNEKSRFGLSVFALDAARKALGYRGNPLQLNENPILALDEQDAEGNYIHPRDLILGDFRNHGAEGRYIVENKLFDKQVVSLVGAKWYDADNTSIQGPGSSGSDAFFSLETAAFPNYPAQSDFKFPNQNLALFTEHIIYLKEHLSLTPGIRYEYIKTGAVGNYLNVVADNAGNPISVTQLEEEKSLKRNFVLMGLGLEYNPRPTYRLYANISQNYRSVTFSDIRVVSPTFIIDPNLKDEKGWTFDVGIRGRKNKSYAYHIGGYGVVYNDRIGTILDNRANRVRKNIGNALIMGIESLVDVTIPTQSIFGTEEFKLNSFINLAYTYSTYLSSSNQNVSGNKVEFVPTWNLKSGLTAKYKRFHANLQYTYLSTQFTDAQNSSIPAEGDLRSGVVGEIPSYGVLDLSLSKSWNHIKWTAGIDNILNSAYFTRRATGYPGPGIIPSEGRKFYMGIQLDIGNKS